MPSPYITRRFLSGCSCSCIRAARSGGSPTGYSDSEYRPEAGFRQYVWAQYCYSLKVPDTSANTDADFCLAHTFLPVKHQIWRKNNPSIRPSICCYICLVCFERVNRKNKKQRKTLSDKRSVRKERNHQYVPLPALVEGVYLDAVVCVFLQDLLRVFVRVEGVHEYQGHVCVVGLVEVLQDI